MRTLPVAPGVLRFAWPATLLIALLMALASVVGLATDLYTTEVQRESFMANDVVNIVVGLPILLGAAWTARHGSLLGLLFWPGALLYVTYNAIVYLFGLPLNVMYLPYLLLVVLSVYTAAGLLASMDVRTIRERTADVMPHRFAGSALGILGVLYALLVVGESVTGLNEGTSPPRADHALYAADMLLSVGWTITAVLLWRRADASYLLGPVALFQGSALFVSVILVVVLQPLMADAPFAAADVVVLLVMGLVCFVPFGLYVRGMAGGATRQQDAIGQAGMRKAR